MGRTNKLVDGCYSFWQGGLFALLQQLGPEYLRQSSIPGSIHEQTDSAQNADVNSDETLFIPSLPAFQAQGLEGQAMSTMQHAKVNVDRDTDLGMKFSKHTHKRKFWNLRFELVYQHTHLCWSTWSLLRLETKVFICSIWEQGLYLEGACSCVLSSIRLGNKAFAFNIFIWFYTCRAGI